MRTMPGLTKKKTDDTPKFDTSKHDVVVCPLPNAPEMAKLPWSKLYKMAMAGEGGLKVEACSLFDWSKVRDVTPSGYVLFRHGGEKVFWHFQNDPVVAG